MITGVSPMFCVFVSFCPSVTSIGVELVSIALVSVRAPRPRDPDNPQCGRTWEAGVASATRT